MANSNREFKESNVNYLNKDFDSFKANLIEYTKTYFPNTYRDFNETSPGMMLIELSAYVGDVLSFYIDQQYKEMMLPLAQERRNIVNIAKMLGYKTKPTVPAYVDIVATQLINATDDINNKQPDYSTATILDSGVQIQSSLDGEVLFETLEPIDFTTSSSLDTAPFEAEFNSDGIVTKYEIVRTAKAISGETKTKTVTVGSPTQYLKLTLTETNVIEILKVEDMNNGNRWYEVDYLAQDKIPQEEFHVNSARTSAYHDISNQVVNVAVPYTLQYIKTGKRFITEVNEDNTTSLVFGNGVLRNGKIQNVDFASLDHAGIVIDGNPELTSIDGTIDPRAGDTRQTLGETPSNTTLEITYRVGGGIRSNVTSGALVTPTNLTSKYLNSNTVNVDVINLEPAYGGNDQETVEEIRHKAKAFFATQNRCVTKEDYEARVLSMPPKFGHIAKVFAQRSSINNLDSSTNVLLQNLDLNGSSGITSADLDVLKAAVTDGDTTIANEEISKIEQFYTDYAALTNKIGTDALATIDLHVLSYDINKNLTTIPATEGITHPLKQNIKNYLANYRLITDQINILDGKIINFGVGFEVIAHRSANKSDVKLRCINKIIEYFDIDKMQFHQTLYTTDLEYELMGLEGVRSVNWVQLTQLFDDLPTGENFGYTGTIPLYDWDVETPDDGQNEAINTGEYGWYYDFAQFYDSAGGAYVSKGVILPTVEPSVFELKNPTQNVRGVVK